MVAGVWAWLYTTAMSGRAGLFWLRIGSLTVLLLALLPNVLYLGHGGLLGGHSHATQGTDATEHASHCHLGPRQCSAGFGSAEALPDTGMTLPFAGTLVAIAQPAPVLKSGLPPARLERPPQGTIPF